MNKSAIKNYAIEARKELIRRVSQKAFEYGVSNEEIIDENSESIRGTVLSLDEKKHRQELIKKVNEKGFDQVIEEVAYTWFNRFIALRYMEVNNYLPTKIRVFTNGNNEFEPEILKEALNLDIEGLNKEYIYDCIQNNKTEELYKYLLIATCNDMGNYLPGMFAKINDYKVLLFPDHLLRDESVLAKLISEIDEDAWLDQVQIIGWLYQYYNTEPKASVYARPKGSKIAKYDIPAVTQLFTPDWIVKYMVENSLGRLWLEGHENNELKSNWRYYLDEAKQEETVEKQLDEIRLNRRNQRIEEVTVIDPCMGSGHILVYAFDVLMQIYESEGWTQRDAAISILENNLYGLDIDERAHQLSYFALMMKARSYNRRVLSKGVNTHLYQIQASNHLPMQNVEYAIEDEKILKDVKTLMEEMTDADEYGSLLTTSQVDYEAIYDYCENHKDGLFGVFVENELLPFVHCAELLSKQYDITVTNPPYTPISNCDAKLQKYVKDNYPDSKSDFCSVFIEKCRELTKQNGFEAMITMHSWMFLSSFEKLREKILLNNTIINMAHLGARAFEEIGGEVVQTTTFVFNKNKVENYLSSFKRLVDFNSQDSKEEAYLKPENLYRSLATNFSKIPGSPIAYWATSTSLNLFKEKKISDYVECKSGIMTGSDKFIKSWFEPSVDKIKFDCNDYSEMGDYTWFPLNSGGVFRKWYGNNLKVVNLFNGGEKIKQEVKNYRLRDCQYYFKPGITWGRITSSKIAFRIVKHGTLFGDAGPLGYLKDYKEYILALLSSKVVDAFLEMKNPTLNYQIADIMSVPAIFENDKEVNYISSNNINLSKQDWDSFETSWDFTVHPLVKNHVSSIKQAYSLWDEECNKRFNTLKANEEELNRIFIDIYGLNDELDPYVEDKDVTVRKADLTRDIKSLISYAVGCMLGRYSLDVDGLAYAGGDFDWSKYSKFVPNKDNVIKISDDAYVEDDIVARFIDFIKVVYGEDTLEENLEFIASALGGKGNSKDVIRNYFLNEFYKDHCKIYQKRPIYWMFDSGKKNGFKCLVYMHRYQPDLVARIRTDYVHNTQSKLNYSINALEGQLDNVSTSDRVRMNKEIKKLKEQADEVRKYEEVVHHYADMMLSIDLDDGVKVNYEKFKNLLSKIR